MKSELRYRLVKPTAVTHDSAGKVTLKHSDASLTLHDPPSHVQQVLDRLQGAGWSKEDLVQWVDGCEDIRLLQRLYATFRQLTSHGLLRLDVLGGTKRVATMTPHSLPSTLFPKPFSRGKKLQLSRFAYLQVEGNGFRLASPLGAESIRVDDPTVAGILCILSEPRTLEEIAALVGKETVPHVETFAGLLAQAHILSYVGDPGDEDGPRTSTALWEFHDLLFHARSRLGRHSEPWGKALRSGSAHPQPPAARTDRREELIPLPAGGSMEPRLRGFAEVVAARRSIREYSDEPLSTSQLGEFLFLSAAATGISHDPDIGLVYRFPYPTGGSLGALEIYPVVDRCSGLEPGLYHYDSLEHGIRRLSTPNQGTNALLEMATMTLAQISRPQVLLVVTARFQRVQWKYRSIAYSLLLKDLGGLYQTFYLVAAHLGLAACALGGGHSDLFASTAGLDYYTEGAIGEFALGSAPDEEKHRVPVTPIDRSSEH